MANIVFILAPLIGSLNSSLKLAKTLRAHGHRVSYMGLADSAEHVLRNGFEFNTIYEKWFPKGLTAKYDSIAAISGSARSNIFRSIIITRRAFLQALLAERDTEFQDSMRAIKPDLVVHIHSDPLMVVLALLALSSGVRVVYLCDVLGRSEHGNIPPIGTDVIPAVRYRGYAPFWRGGRARCLGVTGTCIAGLCIAWISTR